jgi:NADH dehydrogenase
MSEFQQPRPGARHRVVIVGGGFGGFAAARALRHADVEVTLIDRTNHHLFQPLLYQVATGLLSPGQIAPALRGLLRRQARTRVMLAEVTGFDLRRRVVAADAERPVEVPYDTLIVAAGATHSYFDHPEWSAIAPGVKTLDDAQRVRSRILAAFEMAEQASEQAEREAWMTLVVVGAGPTGVELAGQLAILSRRVLVGDYCSIDPATARIVLLDGAPAVLPSFAPGLREQARKGLTRLGVEVQLGTRAVAIDTRGIEVEAGPSRTRIESRTVLWAAGVQASALGRALAEQSGASLDRSGRISVQEDLSLPGHPEVFALGDMVGIEGVPGVAPAAIQEGRYVARVIAARLGGRSRRGFRYRDKGMVATVGRTHAVAQVWRVRLSGLAAMLLYGIVHLTYLTGWGNRYEALARWLWTAIARNRRERLISVWSLAGDREARGEIDEVRRESRAWSGGEGSGAAEGARGG